MKRLFKTGLFAFLIAGITLFASCKKEYSHYSNMQVVENTYTGVVLVTSTGQNPGGDFTGNGSSGIYSFAWNNPQKKATLDFDITTQPGGSCQIILKDARGKEVLNKTRPANGQDSFSGVSDEGSKGIWLVTLKFTNVKGDGSYDIHPGN